MDIGALVSILVPALLAGMLVTLTHVPLGRRVLERGIIFLDLAVAQFAGLGIIAAHTLHLETHGWQIQLVAIIAAIIGVLILNATEKHWPDIQEALIGSMFVLASSGSILLLANDPHGGEQLKELLVGQILWVSYSDLIPVAILYAAILAVWFFTRTRSALVFYILFALSITASVQLVGVYLVFATLILPALAVRKLEKHASVIGVGIGIAGYLLGLVLAALLDLPAGAMSVFMLAIVAFVVAYATRALRAKR